MITQLKTTLLTHRLLFIGFCLALLGTLFPPAAAHLQAAPTPLKPDLQVTNVVVNSNCTATFTITNSGPVDAATPFIVQASPLVVGTLGAQTVTVVTIPHLVAGATFVHVRPNTKILNATTMTVVVDPQNTVAESDESNNTRQVSMPAKCRLLTPVTPVPTREAQ